MWKKLFTKATLVRTLSGILLVIIAIITLITGGDILFFTIAAISLIGMTELYHVLDIQKKPLGITGYLAGIAYYTTLYFQKEEYQMLRFIAFLIAIMGIYVFSFPKYRAEQVMLVFFGFFYVAVMLSFVYQIRLLEEGIFLVWMVFISSWICDTFAYLTGVMFGKRKLAPKLSPKKSIEGSVGGIAASVIIGAIYGFILKEHIQLSFENPVLGCAIVCGVGSIISQIGDLAASGIKRDHEIKDYGKLIPGHGGILDRFDSVIFVAPAIYFLCMFI